jgi:hypothetical protein
MGTFSNDELCSVILNRELAKSIYTGKKFFALNQSRHLKNINPDLDWTQPGGGYRLLQAVALDKYDHLTAHMRERWEMEADEIWQNANDVLNELPNSKVASICSSLPDCRQSYPSKMR